MKITISFRALFAVLLPIVIVFVWWARIHSVVAGGAMLHFPVAGYDPRDLLSGHYVTYRVLYSPADPCLGHSDEELCSCFDRTSNETIWSGSCQEKPTECPAFLKGKCTANRFEANIEKYYFPESYKTQLARIPANASISVATDDAGQGVVTGLFVEGIPVLDWVKQQPLPTVTISE